MMSKTHIAVGVASALTIAQTGSIESCVAAVIGGAAGGIIADCDITPSRAHKDALIGRLIVVALAVVCVAIDYFAGRGVCNYVIGHAGMPLVAGVALFVALTFIGGHTDHRSFTHSIVAMAAFCLSAYLIYAPILPYFAVGYVSHLVLDVTNKQGIRLFWPLSTQPSLGICTAKGIANTAVMVIGVVTAVLLLALRLAPLFGFDVPVP